MMSENDAHSLRSTHREALLEHLFSGEIMRRLWLRGDWRLEVLKPQVDDGGYDLVLEANNIVRHVQLKASYRGSTVRDTKVNTLLAAKPSGCVVFLWFDNATLDFGPFGFFGAAPGKPLPSLEGLKIAKHTKGNKDGVKGERSRIRVLPLSKFERMNTFEEVVERLFGA